MQIMLHDGKKEVMLTGEDGQFELRYAEKDKDKQGKSIVVWNPRKFFGSVEGAMNALLRMKVSNSDAKSLAELVDAVNQARLELRYPV